MIAYSLQPNITKLSYSVIYTLLFTFSFKWLLGLYSLFIFIPSYLFLSIIIDNNKSATYVKYFFGTILLIMFLLLILEYTNPILFFRQVNREFIGADKVAELDTRGVNILANEIKKKNISIENIRNYISYNKIQYSDDFDTWGVNDYWATPYETITKGKEDCDGISILTKAVSDYLDKDEEYKKLFEIKQIETKTVIEPYHMYVLTNGINISKQNTKIKSFKENIKEQWNDLPETRKKIFVILTPFIILRRLFIKKKVIKDENRPRRKSILQQKKRKNRL